MESFILLFYVLQLVTANGVIPEGNQLGKLLRAIRHLPPQRPMRSTAYGKRVDFLNVYVCEFILSKMM